jgi:hypothetical protein
MLVARATGDQSSRDAEYQRLRRILVSAPEIDSKLPKCVKTCRTLFEFWGFIQPKFRSYQERREYLKDEFEPLLSMLEAGALPPMDEVAIAVQVKPDWNGVQAAWRRALERKSSDPEGAITAARTLLETVCKHILDEADVAYDSKIDLPKLYGLTAKQLRLAPGQHTEEIFRQILGGCHSVVQGLGSLRSKIGDAHGQGKKAVKPASRHAELAVNLAGAMATFLTLTWEKVRLESSEGT